VCCVCECNLGNKLAQSIKKRRVHHIGIHTHSHSNKHISWQGICECKKSLRWPSSSSIQAAHTWYVTRSIKSLILGCPTLRQKADAKKNGRVNSTMGSNGFIRQFMMVTCLIYFRQPFSLLTQIVASSHAHLLKWDTDLLSCLSTST